LFVGGGGGGVDGVLWVVLGGVVGGGQGLVCSVYGLGLSISVLCVCVRR